MSASVARADGPPTPQGGDAQTRTLSPGEKTMLAEAPAPTPAALPVEALAPDARRPTVVASPLPAVPTEEPVSVLGEVSVDGHLLEPKDKLLKFLGLYPGAPFGPDEQQQVTEALARLGYRVVDDRLDPHPGRVNLTLKVAPVRVVRRVRIHGNFPLFEDEVLRHITLRSGTPLPPDEELRAALDAEEDRLLVFLQRDGYFGGTVKITPLTTANPEWIDLDVRMYLGSWYRLGGLRITGHTSVPIEELTRVFDHCCLWWGRFRVDRMREDARAAERLLASRGYPAARVVPTFDLRTDADPKTGRVTLPIRVTEKRKVEVKFVGNRSQAERDLRAQLTLFTAGAYDEIELSESAKALQRFYQTNGYFEARVGFEVHRLSSDLEQVDFLIEEGPELKVRRVDIGPEGNDPLHFTEEEIRVGAQLETKIFPALGLIGLGEGGFITSVQLQQDVERIVEFYKARGFPQVRVRGQVARDADAFSTPGLLGADVATEQGRGDDLYVRFSVVEGKREQFGGIDVVFTGPHSRSVEEIRRVLKLAPGEAYTQAAFGDAYRRLLTLYAASARPYLKVGIAGSHWDPSHTNYFARFEIDEQERVTFGEILIRGNFRTRQRVILADLPFKTGDPFDVNKIGEAERNLQTHLIFNTATVQVALPHRNPVPILVTVQERYFEQVVPSVLVGLATDRLPHYFYVGAGLLMPNFFGLGSQLELHGDFDDPTSFGAQLRYTDLRAFGPGWRFDLTGFYRQEVTVRLGPITSFGASLALTRSITRALRVFGRYDFYESKIGVGLNRIDGPHDIQNVSDNTETAKVTLGVTWDKRTGADGQPNPLMPRKGFLLSAAVGWAFPTVSPNFGLRILQAGGGDHNFLIFSGQAIGLLPFKINKSELTLISNIRYDEGVPIGESALPLVERFYAGGDTTTRGYETDELKTEIVRGAVNPLTGQTGVRIIPQGGNLRFLGTVELQFPIAPSFLGLPWPWVGAIFYDVGAVADAPNLIAVSDFKQSVGMSLLRVLTPFGPLSLEYAYPLNPSLADELWKTNPWYSHFPGRIHFNWGIPLSRL